MLWLTRRWSDISLLRRIGDTEAEDKKPEGKEVWEGMYHSYPVAVKVISTHAISHSALDEVSLLAYLF